MAPTKALTGTAASRLRSRPRRSPRLRHLKREGAHYPLHRTEQRVPAPLPHPLRRRHLLLKGPLRHLPDLFSRMTCPRCANQNPPDAAYCNRCGQQLSVSSTAPAASLLTEMALWRKFIGPRAGYYLDRFRLFHEGERERFAPTRSEEHTSELQSQPNLVCRLLLENKTPHNTFKFHEHIVGSHTYRADGACLHPRVPALILAESGVEIRRANDRTPVTIHYRHPSSA